ncbi:hypothetical protein ACH4MA_28995 [Streptomyces roseolus]|uniref:hypothetical protein n=1 Tax=Streptomyces roseolus TaxID=67358 RepID=UPI00378C53E2
MEPAQGGGGGGSSTRMQLNRVPDEPDGKSLSTNSQGDLKVVDEHLAKIGDHAFGLYNRLWREGRVAATTADSAASDLSGQGFELGGALSHVSVKWESAPADLMDACAHISNHMDYTKNAHAGDEIFIERRMSGIATLDASLNEQDLTRFLYTVGQNPEGYAAVSVGQHAYTAGMLEYHFAHPDAFVDEKGNTPAQNLEKATGAIAHNAGEIQGMLGAGRAYAAELDAGNKDAEFNDALTKAGELGESLVGIGVGAATASAVGPGAVIAGGAAETVAGEIIGSLTEGLMKDSSGEVVYRNGEEINATRESTFALVEKAAKESEKSAGVSYPSVVSSIAGQIEAGFTSAHTDIRDYCEGVGVPNALEKDK